MQSFTSVIATWPMSKDLAAKLFIVFICPGWTRPRAAGNTALVQAGQDVRAIGSGWLMSSGRAGQ